MSFAPVFSRFLPASSCRVSARTTRSSLRTLLFGIAVLLPALLRAQAPGTRDTSYASALDGTTTYALAIQYDPKGVETIIDGGDGAELAFTEADGTNLSTYTDPAIGGLNRLIYTAVPELLTITGTGTHNVYLGGRFGKNELISHPPPSQNVARFSPAGVIDTAFQPGTGANDIVTAIVPLDNGGEGGLIVGGLFTTFNGQSFPRLVRLNENGSINSSFNRVNVTDGVFAMAPQIDPATGASNGQVLVAGDFTTVNNAVYAKLFRMDEAGNLDASFQPAIDSRVLAIAVQPDGKIVIGGQFSVVNGQSVGHLARLNIDGSLDATFNASVSVLPDNTSAPVAAYTLRLLADGRMYVGGQFYAVDGAPRRYLALLNADGSLDTSFDPGNTITNSVQSVAVQADNRVLVAETFSKKTGSGFPPSLIRLFGEPVESVDSVSLAVLKASASEGATGVRQNGLFEFTRAGDLSQALTVYFAVSGTAQSGTAYKPLVAAALGGGVYRVTIPAGASTLKLKLKPRNVVLPDAPETVTLTVLPSQDTSAFYDTGGAPVAGTVSIGNAR